MLEELKEIHCLVFFMSKTCISNNLVINISFLGNLHISDNWLLIEWPVQLLNGKIKNKLKNSRNREQRIRPAGLHENFENFQYQSGLV